ncbi:MAG: hypothetical protein V2J42_02090 [Wenzhouxiangella sp.]|jgi:hypothetical protein|nr:hypothetical protein [Wenzhouxiangella sp.]
MHLILTLLTALLLIPAALAGIAAGLSDLAASSGDLSAQVARLIDIGQSLWPACTGLALVASGALLLLTSLILLARGLQSDA